MSPEVKPIPDGYPRVSPYLCVNGGTAALEFYKSVFGATERMRMPAPDGRIGHAELQFGDSVIMLADEYPEMGIRSPRAIGGTPVTISVYVEDVDAVFKIELSRPGRSRCARWRPSSTATGRGQFEDPFGHRWSVATHVEDVAPDEMERRAANAMSGQNA